MTACCRRFPQIKPNLLVTHREPELFHRNPSNGWAKIDVVYLIAGRHKLLLWQPMGAAGALGGAHRPGRRSGGAVGYEAMWIAWAGAALRSHRRGLARVGLLDWANDYYIVTSQRLVYLEKIIGIYDSRQEAAAELR